MNQFPVSVSAIEQSGGYAASLSDAQSGAADGSRFSESERQAALSSLYGNSEMNARAVAAEPQEMRVFGVFNRNDFSQWPDDGEEIDFERIDLDSLYEQSVWDDAGDAAGESEDTGDEADCGDYWRAPDDDSGAGNEADGEADDADDVDDADDADDKPSRRERGGAPEWYDWRPPAGFSGLDRALLDDFEPVARALDLSNDQANRLLALYADRILPALETRSHHDRLCRRNEWAAAVRQDPDIGGDRLAHNLAIARRALADYGSPELCDILDESGLGNHPALIRCFVQMAQALGLQPE